MTAIQIIELVIVLCAIATATVLLSKYKSLASEEISKATIYKTALLGFVTNFLDTIGIGSFAVSFAGRKLFKIMPDYLKFVGVLNTYSVFVAVAQSFLFLNAVNIDPQIIIISCTCMVIGSFISARLVNHIPQHIIKNIVIAAFIFTLIIVISNQFNILHIHENNTTISTSRYILLYALMFFSGCLPAFGIGYYSMIIALIFLLGFSPILAYPIMTTCSALQMPVTSIMFIKKENIYPKSAIIMSLCGIVGVICAALVLTKLNTHYMKWLLAFILAYNIINLILSKKKNA